MSDALDYLMKVRPDAMKSYFGFLREAGSGLDARTRSIISIITKVDAQTERGFRQYLSRGLREGVTPAEVIDAMLLAFPTLGLTKILWAVDILLQMDLPEFQPDRLGKAPCWHVIAPLAEFGDGCAFRDCGERGVFVYREGDRLRVFDNHCPHQRTPIPEAALSGTTLTCPKHEWKFNVRDGGCIGKGNRPLRQLKHRIEEGNLLVFW